MYPYLPQNPALSIIIENKTLNCRPCSKIGFDRCPKKHFKCMNDLNAALIADSLEQLNRLQQKDSDFFRFLYWLPDHVRDKQRFHQEAQIACSRYCFSKYHNHLRADRCGQYFDKKHITRNYKTICFAVKTKTSIGMARGKKHF